MTFEEWWDSVAGTYGYTDVSNAAVDAWEAATLAERERCVEICRKLASQFENLPMAADAFGVAMNSIMGLYKDHPELRSIYDF